MAAPHLSRHTDKHALRRSLRGVAGDDAALRARLLAFLLDTEARLIGAVWPLPGEPDLRPLLAALDAAGREVALPVVLAADAPLAFRAWRPGTPLAAGPFGTQHPAEGAPVDPDLLLVPLLGFGPRLPPARPRRRVLRPHAGRPHRLVRAIGVAYAAREVERVSGRTPRHAARRGGDRARGDRVRILFLGDVVGRSGREAIERELPALKTRLRCDLVVVNGENASHGFGLAPAMADAIFAAGADVITLGNHAFDRKELVGHIERTPRIVRPLNFPPGTPGGPAPWWSR